MTAPRIFAVAWLVLIGAAFVGCALRASLDPRRGWQVAAIALAGASIGAAINLARVFL